MQALQDKLVAPISQRTSLLFFIMTFSAVVPLYFESVRVLAGLVFLGILVTLSFKSYQTKSYQISKMEKAWIYVAVIYAGFFIFNYFLHTPYSKDGEWRNAAPIFILWFSYWYFLSIRLNLQKQLINYVALSSIAVAVILFAVELIIADSLVGYRFGLVSDGSRGLAATGFILPITTVLLTVLWLQNRSWLYFVLLLTGLLLSGLNGSRTAFIMVMIPILAGLAFLLIWNRTFSKKIKVWAILVIMPLLLMTAFLAKDKIKDTFTDFSAIEKGQYMSSMGLRMAMWDTGIIALEDHWLLGVGPSDYKMHIVSVVNKMDYSPEVKGFISGVMQIHNQYLMTSILSGVVGLMSLFFFLGYPVWVFMQSFKEGNEIASVVSIGLIIGIVFVMFFGAIFTYTYTTIFYMLATSSLVSFFAKSREQ
ncbi:MAG: O-antigen ligase family protein [Gammaproteobacteria bacterium]|nr:O-antigen ligase family protein [Gammaproteobacteria bacterium]